jgi:RNase P protein component
MNERRILSLLRTGQVVFRYPLKVCYQEGEGDFGVSVPKRNFKRAVRRNLLKRRLREAWRRSGGPGAAGKLDVFIYYIGKQVEDYERIEKSVSQVLDDLASR